MPNPLPDHLIRPCQHVRRNRQADLFGCFQIDDELKLRRLLGWTMDGFKFSSRVASEEILTASSDAATKTIAVVVAYSATA